LIEVESRASVHAYPVRPPISFSDKTMRHARTLLLAAAPALASCAPRLPAPTPGHPGNAEESLVAVERAFEQATMREGVRDGFIRFADDSAVIFRPEPVNALASFRSRPATSIRLAWHPAYARVARSGDLGFTTGPSQVMDSTGALLGYGNYVAVWRRNADGWKYAVDLGISNPRPDPEPPLWVPAVGGASPTPAGTANAAGARSLLAADSAFAARAASGGLAAALQAFGDAGMRLLRNGAVPHVGLPAAVAAAAADSARHYSATPARAFVSAAGDLGWSYGEYRAVLTGAGRRETGHYVRIWSRDGDGPWRLLLDVVSPRPSERDE
jgi:ketosteroid isomerase-like protein